MKNAKRTMWKKTAIVTSMMMALPCLGIAQPSTICNDDGTVTFQYRADKAQKVAVDVQFAGKHDMKRDANGLWTITLGPAAPDMYPYHFEVDGVSVMDDQNAQYFPNEGFKNSLLEIPSRSGSLIHDIRNVPHGIVEYIYYNSKNLGGVNQAVVYLPPSYYEQPGKRYPVFYLISGTTDTEEVYYKVGRMNYIMDNLLAEGAAEEMIIVLPYGNPAKLLPPKANDDGMPQLSFGNDVFSNDLTSDLMPYVESHYRTINDRDHRAIGGFSRGGNQGLMNGLMHLDLFSYLCSYSSFTMTNLSSVYDNAADTNSKIHLFWLGVGTDDFLYGTARDYMQFLDDKGIRSVKEFTTDKFGHTWMNAKYFLDKTLRLLFKPDKCEQAMRNGKPAPAATGKEEAFTPSVMARLFPKPIISPEYQSNGIVFRCKAPDAKQVLFESELLNEPVAMVKDADGIWSVTIKDNFTKVFKYCFVVDGIRVADAYNMLLSPDKGFKYSISSHPAQSYDMVAMTAVEHGRVCYDLNQHVAVYLPPTWTPGTQMFTVNLVPGANDTWESWFKTGGVNAIADKLIGEGKAQPFMIVVTDNENGPRGTTLRADDYKTWPERREALVKLLERFNPGS